MASVSPQNQNPNPNPNPNHNRKKKKGGSNAESQFRYHLDQCLKKKDLHGALALYESAIADGIHLSAYHFTAILHLLQTQTLTLDPDSAMATIDSGFDIYNRMVSLGIAPTESTLTTMARISALRPNGGDFAFDVVKNMKEKHNLVPKLRTFGPALFAFCKELEAEKAYEVERVMAETKVSLEEPEIAALLEVSAKTCRGEKVYEYLLKLRNGGSVGVSTVEILEGWFRSEAAAGSGRGYWDVCQVKDAILTNGGGWHGTGWLGEGRWEVRKGNVSTDGVCSCCGWRLACVDIERKEAERFAESVAGLAMERETHSNFKQFQEWLERHANYEAVIDGANIALYKQNYADGGFSLSQIDSVVGELKRSKGKWPLVILHNKRFRTLMENPSNRPLLETWRKLGALYTTPNGSNDDWYWLFAAVKLNCLLVTNDEMRDHIFELLGSSFFPKWKERHQVRYTFVKGDLSLVMPPPYSVVIQESEIGSWHVPLNDDCNDERSRIWVCITRPGSCKSNMEANGGYHLIHRAELHKVDTCAAEDMNGMKTAASLHLYNGSEKPTTGKRKERSPSPSRPLADNQKLP